MRTLNLIRLALLIFILCWVSWNQYADQVGFGIEVIGVRKSGLEKCSYAGKKVMASALKSTTCPRNPRYQDY